MSRERAETEDGFELGFGTNHLGHFAYLGRILPAVTAVPGSRVVTVTGLSQRMGRIRWDDLHLRRRYRQSDSYAQSKLACLQFALGLQRRLVAAGAGTASLAAHPGFADTDILDRDPTSLNGRIQRRLGERFVQTPAEASRSSLRAATDPAAYGGQLYGPGDRAQTAGPPVPVPLSRRSLDEASQDRLWELSERLTGVEFTVAPV